MTPDGSCQMNIQTETIQTTDKDRQLLVAVNRWRRANGWQARGYNNWWDSPDRLTSVWWDESGLLTVNRSAYRHQPFPFTATVPVSSVRQAVDVLVAFDVLPVEFAAAYEAGRIHGLELGRAA